MTDKTIGTAAAYTTLQSSYRQEKSLTLREMFQEDPSRFDAMSVDAAGIFLDYSKNRVTASSLASLFDLARECEIEAKRDALFSGEKINETEGRAVLHTALRAPADAIINVDGENVVPAVHDVLQRMRRFVDRVRGKEWRGFGGDAITDIVNIGIGGSDLGPKMVCQALRPFADPALRVHFVSNVDGHDLDACLSTLQPETTLFIVASKTFTTQETMMNAETARRWLLAKADAAELPRHFVALSTNTKAVTEFGIDPANMFPFWDWVGGRYSVWSAIGLSIALSIGFEGFESFLAGAHSMDRHFREAPLDRNMPVILGMIGIWYRNFFGTSSVSIAPYHQDLRYFPGYLQQLEMESNGKQVTMGGAATPYTTCPVIWGDVGTNGQHAYFQLLHQGTEFIPVDFIAALKPSHELPGHHAALLANCFAQSEALMQGKSTDEARAELANDNADAAEIEKLAAHKSFPGNRPSNTILLESLDPASLGALIALYEHKTFVQGCVWGLNSFDQWGVELGKVLAKAVRSELTGTSSPDRHDSSTNGLIAKAKSFI